MNTIRTATILSLISTIAVAFGMLTFVSVTGFQEDMESFHAENECIRKHIVKGVQRKHIHRVDGKCIVKVD